VLASDSPRRKSLLLSLLREFEIVSPDVEELPRVGETPRDMAGRLAGMKALSVSGGMPDACVIGADTVVDIDGLALSKPRDRNDSLKMLHMLNGRTHLVHTGIAVAISGKLAASEVETTGVTFGHLSDEEILEFALSGAGDDKAGSYAIQGRGALLVEKIEGDYYNVVGLPIYRLKKILEKFVRL
jgi:septum formation protein